VYEHVTGGGMARESPPPGLLREADLMVRTLIEDLRGAPGVELVTTRDARLTPVPGIRSIPVTPADDLHRMLTAAIDACDAVWPTAPETGGALAELAAAVLDREKFLLGSRPDAVRIATSKLATARTLSAAGVPVVDTWASAQDLVPLPGPWVTKPDDGAGAEGVQLAADWRGARDRLTGRNGVVAQPWIEGDSLSLSLLCADGAAELLAVNRQRIRLEGDAVLLEGIEVNALADESGTFAALGRAVAAALPGLWGYVGVDLVRTGETLRVLEVNPRLTTSYCGLRQARGVSVAGRVLALLAEGGLKCAPAPGRGTIEHLTLQADHA
jgi:tyramine---L-glutamate ligase